MTASRVSAAKKLAERPAEEKLRAARVIVANLLYNCAEHPEQVKAMTVPGWIEIFDRLREALD